MAKAVSNVFIPGISESRDLFEVMKVDEHTRIDYSSDA